MFARLHVVPHHGLLHFIWHGSIAHVAHVIKLIHLISHHLRISHDAAILLAVSQPLQILEMISTTLKG